ncbi:molybdopterin converting factor subunit 1 [Minwuia sp.]|uniref:molybdopterin converting factor subunit 1 n=1 Tax=Minwuia sp. TaxID=2493630 RepID=UPI003A8F074A
MKLLYFAWVRERTGVHEEDYALPAGVATVADLMTHLRGRGDGFDRAFADPDRIRAAVNQETAAPGDPVCDADEVAFFPPMTGG